MRLKRMPWPVQINFTSPGTQSQNSATDNCVIVTCFFSPDFANEGGVFHMHIEQLIVLCPHTKSTVNIRQTLPAHSSVRICIRPYGQVKCNFHESFSSRQRQDTKAFGCRFQMTFSFLRCSRMWVDGMDVNQNVFFDGFLLLFDGFSSFDTFFGKQ